MDKKSAIHPDKEFLERGIYSYKIHTLVFKQTQGEMNFTASIPLKYVLGAYNEITAIGKEEYIILLVKPGLSRLFANFIDIKISEAPSYAKIAFKINSSTGESLSAIFLE